MKRRTPNERELTDLIAQAFERTPAPDPRRLAAIEERLLERPRRPVGTAWWWLFAVLATGAASALWWAVDYDSADGPAAPPPAVTPPAVEIQPARPGPSEGADTKPAGEAASRKGPVIYQREN